MTKKIIFWLSFSIIIFTCNSCAHDEFFSSYNTASKGYTNKSVFEEDEKYIKNVMKVYQEHEGEIKKGTGTPLWDYATTMGHTDESFLIVPVAVGNKIVSCIQVPRNGDQIRFLYENNPDHLRFFQGYTTSTKRKAVKSENLTSQTAKGLAGCSFTSVSMWYPDDEYGSNAGHWETDYIVTCPPEQIDGGGDGVENPTYPYPGNGGGSQPPLQPLQSPCKKAQKIVKNAKTKTLLTDLKGKTTSATAEHGYLLEESNGVISETHIEGIPGTGEINFNVNAAIDGYIHSHYQGLLSVFSPSDLFALAQIYKKGMIKNTNTFAIGVVTASGTQYMMVIDDLTKFDNFINTLFTGNEIDTNIANLYETSYNILQINNTNSVANNESNFLTFLEQNNLGLKMLKGDSTFNNWSLLTKNSEGTVVLQNCN